MFKPPLSDPELARRVAEARRETGVRDLDPAVFPAPEGAHPGMEEFTEIKYVCRNWA